MFNNKIDNARNTDRVSYIDVAKGILILLVIYDHLPDVFLTILEQSNAHIDWLNEQQWTYKLFFMPAFFCMTGFCANFKKSLKPFIISNFKSLIVPNIVFGLLLGLEWKYIFLRGGSFWFLSALFLSKLIYWILINYLPKSRIIRLFVLIILAFVGFLMNHISPRYDLWYVHYAFSLCIFIEIGAIFRQIRNNYCFVIGSIFYIIMCICLEIFEIHKPVVAMGNRNMVYEVPLYLLVASFGTCVVIVISKWINSNRVLEFFGKHSLLFYVFQIKILEICERVYLSTIAVSCDWGSACLFVISVFIMTTFVLSVISQIITANKYLSFLIGRF